MDKYQGAWEDYTELVEVFFPSEIGLDAPEGMATDAEILVASLTDDGEEPGEDILFVLFERNGTLYEVNADGGWAPEWAPEETSWAALKVRQFDTDELAQAIERLAP